MPDAIPVCLPPDPQPRRPRLAVPPGAVDTHTHVFEARYPPFAHAGLYPA